MQLPQADIAHWILCTLLILSSLGVILAKKPVHAALSFFVTLLSLAGLYFELSAHFIAVLQILVYAGAILVLFIFVIVLFQDAHEQLSKNRPQSRIPFLIFAAVVFVATLAWLGGHFLDLEKIPTGLPKNYGTAQALGYDLYVNYFFPFEAVIFLFLIAVVGALYIAKRNEG